MKSHRGTSTQIKLLSALVVSYRNSAFLFHTLSPQGKKRQYDQEVENLEKQQKQTIERLEQDHTNRLRDEAKRIKAEQDKELSKFQNMLKNRKKEVTEKEGRRVECTVFMHVFVQAMTCCLLVLGMSIQSNLTVEYTN